MPDPPNPLNPSKALRLPRLLLVAFSLFSLCTVPAGCKKNALPASSPSGMVLLTSSGERTATLGARWIYKLAPREFQPPDAVVRVRELSTRAIAETRARDVYVPTQTPPYGIVGYWQGTGHNPDALTDPQTIYLVPHRSEVDIAHTAIHEWGHSVFWTQLGQGESAEWAFVYHKLLAGHMLPSGYELQGPNEAFAEYFALWCAKRQYATAPNVPAEVRVYFDTLLSRRK